LDRIGENNKIMLLAALPPNRGNKNIFFNNKHFKLFNKIFDKLKKRVKSNHLAKNYINKKFLILI